MVEYTRALERIAVGGRARIVANVVSSGIVLGNLLISSSQTLGDFAVLRTDSGWLYAAAFICGSALGLILDRTSTVLYGICAMSAIAVLIFTGVLTSAALLNGTPILDVILLLAFQRSFPSFIAICVLGCVGAFLSSWLRLSLGRL